VVAAFGCSLINAFDDLKPAQDSGTDTAVVTDTAVENDTSDDTVDTGSPIDTAVVMETGGDADTGPVDKGLIVVGAFVAGDAGPAQTVLSVLDPENGHRLGTDEKVTAPIIRYDGVRDLWYFFTTTKTTSFSLVETDVVTLSVRQWNPTTKAFVEKGKTVVPTPLADETTVVLRNRGAYVAQAPVDGGMVSYSLVAIDTTDPTMPKASTATTALSEPPIGATGTRASAGAGGTMNLLYVQNCVPADGGPTTCELAIDRAIYPSAATSAPNLSPTRTVIASVPSLGDATSPSWASFLNAGAPYDVFAYPPITTGAKSTIVRLEPSTGVPIVGSSPISFGPSNRLLRPMAVAECAKAALIVDLLGQTLFAVPLSNDPAATQTGVSLGRPGQRVYWEPYTKTALAPYKQSINYAISAYTVGGTEKAPTLTFRGMSSWSPPVELQPNTLATKQPVDYTCP
jgi:hypothetical protein